VLVKLRIFQLGFGDREIFEQIEQLGFEPSVADQRDRVLERVDLDLRRAREGAVNAARREDRYLRDQSADVPARSVWVIHRPKQQVDTVELLQVLGLNLDVGWMYYQPTGNGGSHRLLFFCEISAEQHSSQYAAKLQVIKQSVKAPTVRSSNLRQRGSS
jgi:hypothetical protein